MPTEERNSALLEKGEQRELVSVIVPVYKVEKYLPKCVESILEQTYQNLQIILVDDGSPDCCGAMCDAYAQQDGRVEVVHKENGGLASARNAGLNVARGEWVAWVDSDDWIEKDMIQYLLEGAAQEQADIAICGRYEVYPRKKYFQGVDKITSLTSEEALHMLLDVNNRQIENFVWDKLWRRSLFSGIAFPEGKTFEDFAVTFRLIERAGSIVFLPDAKYYYLQRGGSIMKDASLTNRINRYEAAKTRYDGMIERWPQFETMLADRCIRMAVDIWSNYYRASRAERVAAKPRLREIARFVGPYVKQGFDPEVLGRAGRMMMRLLPYPYWWAFSVASLIRWLYELKKRPLRKRVLNALREFKRVWIAAYNAAKHFAKNGWARRGARYIKHYRDLSIKENMILYDSFWGRGAMCNPYALFEYLLHDPAYAGLEHVWALDTPKEYADIVERYRGYPNVRFVRYMQRDYLRALCEAKYLFNNTAFPRFYIKREGQVYVNTWHGIPLKKLGPDVPGGAIESGNAIRNFLQTDYVVSANPFLTRIYRDTYHMGGMYQGRIIEEGYPRLDTLVRHSKREYKDQLRRMGIPIDPGKKIILYAPTWRENKNNKKQIASVLEEYHQIKTRIETELPEYQVLVKVHQYVYQQIKGTNYPAYIIPATVDANEVLPVADILLGDYSSIYFDYLYFERPILFYIPDIAQYADYRGLYMPMDTLPGPASEDLGEVIGWLREIDTVSAKYRQKLLEAKAWCCNYDVGNIAKRISEIVFQNRDEGYTLVDVRDTRKKVLLQTGGLGNEALVYTVKSLLERIDLERYDVTLATPMPTTWTEREFYEQLDHRIRVEVQNRYISVTYLDDVKNRLLCAYGLSGWRRKIFPERIYREEVRKRYFDREFDFAVHLGGYNFSDLMIVALLRGEDPEAADFDLKQQNQWAFEALLADLKKETL